EALDGALVRRGLRGKDLDDDVLPQRLVPGAVDRAHAPFPDLGDDLAAAYELIDETVARVGRGLEHGRVLGVAAARHSGSVAAAVRGVRQAGLARRAHDGSHAPGARSRRLHS